MLKQAAGGGGRASAEGSSSNDVSPEAEGDRQMQVHTGRMSDEEAHRKAALEGLTLKRSSAKSGYLGVKLKITASGPRYYPEVTCEGKTHTQGGFPSGGAAALAHTRLTRAVDVAKANAKAAQATTTTPRASGQGGKKRAREESVTHPVQVTKAAKAAKAAKEPKAAKAVKAAKEPKGPTKAEAAVASEEYDGDAEALVQGRWPPQEVVGKRVVVDYVEEDGAGNMVIVSYAGEVRDYTCGSLPVRFDGYEDAVDGLGEPIEEAWVQEAGEDDWRWEEGAAAMAGEPHAEASSGESAAVAQAANQSKRTAGGAKKQAKKQRRK